MTEDLELASLNFVELGQDGERRLSHEDIAWADSCLSKDLDFSESGWDSFKDALLETLDAQNYSSPYERDNPLVEDKMEIFPSGNTGNVHKVKVKNGVSFAASSEGTDKSQLVLQPLVKEGLSSENIKDLLDLDNTPVSIASTSEGAEHQTGDFWSTHKMEDVFLPTYDENLKDLGISDPDVDFVFQEFQLEQSTEDIFKIWEFDIPSEDDDLTEQLNKALGEISLETTTSVSDDSEAMKGLQGEALNDLIYGIGNLTLGPVSD